MFNTPSGSPLDPTRNPVGALGALPMAVNLPVNLPETIQAPTGSLASLPQAPVIKKHDGINMWDREHIAQTLAEISRGFMSGGNVLQGLAAAGTNVADRALKLRQAELGTDDIGGPDNAFSIHTDKYGNRTYSAIPEVQDYLKNKERLKDAPKPGDSQTWLGDAAYAVSQLPEAQRPGAWDLAIQQGRAAGYDVSEAPSEWSPTYANFATNRNIGARQGSANAATASNRAAIDADRDAARAISERRANASIANSTAANARAAESHAKSMRAAPPSKRKGNSDLDYILGH